MEMRVSPEQIATIEEHVLAATTFSARLVGRTPLLMHSDQAMLLEASGTTRGKRKLDAAEEAEAGAYRDPSGALYIRTRAVWKALVEAAAMIGGVKTPESARELSSLRPTFERNIEPPEPEGFILIDAEGEPITEYEISEMTAVVGTGRVRRARPRLEEWGLVATMEYDSGVIEPQWILEALVRAGKKKGLGDFRPEKTGRFGQFRVSEFSWA